jgi:predicted acyltransferase
MTTAIAPEPIRVEPSAIIAPTPTQRVMSIDALRGLDMFFIVGVEQIIDALSKMFPMQPTLESRLQHAPWAGFHFYDLIFPLFAFIIGVSLVFSLSKAVAKEGKGGASLKTIKRGIILFLLGVVLYGGMSRGVDHLRILGVLQRLAICSVFGGLAFIWLNTRAIVALTVTLLVGYWAMLTFIPVPGFGAGDYAEGHNLTNWIDKNYLPFFKWDGDHDPEGILSSLPAIASTLLGIFAGLVVKNGLIPPRRKVRLLLLWGIAGVLAGLAWHTQFPIIKKIWTSSFVLFTAGISSILLGLFYWMIDIKMWRGWARPFVWIGMNAITIYVIVHLVNLQTLSSRILGGEIQISEDMFYSGLGELVISLLALCFSFWICKFLYDRKIFLRV